MSEIWLELRRRNVFRVAVAYVVLGWVLLQLTGLVVPGFDLPGWTFRFITFVLIIGFPLVLIFAWAFELTPEGLKRTGVVDPQASVAAQTGRKIDFIIIGVLSLALLFFIVDRLFMAPSESPASPQEVVRSSIAVLPFVNMSSDPEQEYFSDGISEEILNVLAQIPDLHVTSRSSAFQFRGRDIHIPTVAEQLGVANILEGSVRKSGTRIRITAQLIDASTDRHLWTHTYDRELTDIFAIQDEISRAIVDALHVHLGLEPATLTEVRETDAEAYRLYLLGRHNFEQRTQDTLYKAIDFFDQAIAIDPGYAPAYSGKADAYMLLDGYGDLSQDEAASFADPLIEKALELDPDLADVYASKGMSLQQAGRIEASLSAFDRAIDLNPNFARAWHWKAISFRRTGDPLGAMASWQKAHALDPLSPVILGGLIAEKVLFGQFEEARELLEKLRATAPQSYKSYSSASFFQGMTGNWSMGYTLASKAFDVAPGSTAGLFGFAQLNLKAFDGKTPGLSQNTRININIFANPAQAWQDWQALPEAKKSDGSFNESMAWGASVLGNYEATIELLEGQPGFTDGFPGPLFGADYPAYILAPALVLARQRTGDEAGARRLLEAMGTYVKVMKEQGATWTLPLLEAEVHALKGEDDAAIAALELAHREGYLAWFELNYPFFDDLRDREDFQAIVRSVDARVNEERAKLGWEPKE